MKKIGFIILNMGIYLFSFSQAHFRFKNFDTRDGLTHNQANLLIDSKGFLWAGTEFGLNQFNGIEFEKWFHVPGDTTSLINNKINNLAEDTEGQIWIATEKGISVYDRIRGKFKSFHKIPTENAGYILLEQPGVFCDKDGDIWIGNGKGSVILYKTKTGKFFNIPIQLSAPGRIQNNYVGGFWHDRKNRIWVATSFGIYLLDKSFLTAKPYRINEQYINGPLLNTCTHLFETAHGMLLCGTWNAGYLIFDEHLNQFEPSHGMDGPFLPGSVVFNFGQFENTVFFATLGGLYFCDEKDLSATGFSNYTRLDSDRNDPSTIASFGVTSIVNDAAGHLWISGDAGISLLYPGYSNYKMFSYDDIVGFKDASPVSVAQNSSDLLVGVNNKVLVFNLDRETFNDTLAPIVDRAFYRFIESGDHYFQPNRKELYEYDENLKLVRTIREKHLHGGQINIFNAFKDSKGNVWSVTSRYGLRKHDIDGTVIPFLHDTSQIVHSVGDIIGGLAESNTGNIYAGGKALFIMKNGESMFSSISILKGNERNEIRALKLDNHMLWIGSHNGLFSYDETTGSVRHHQLPSHVNYVIEEMELDDAGNIWLISSSGLLKYNPKDSSVTQFGQQAGWPPDFSTIAKLDDGSIALGVKGGILLFDPAQLKTESYSPSPMVTEIVIDEEQIIRIPKQDTTYRFRYNQSIRFNYISLTYHNAANNLYQWHLKGLDERWHDAGNLTSQPFATLGPGKYSFSVRSANANEVWAEGISTIHFIVMPPFYRTTWFMALAAFIIFGVIYLFYRSRLQKALQIERMRTRIATDLHDDIGATLSSISFYSEAVNQRTKARMPEVTPILEKMGETSRLMVSSMSDIVWAINPQNDDMRKMLERMQSYAKELSAIKEKPIVIIIDEKTHHLKPRLEHRRNIYLIFKEALINSLKYADSSQIRVNISLKDKMFQMQIADDGRGFDPSADGEGNGIKNMQRRAEDIGGRIKIISGMNQGTVIDLEVEI